MLSLSAIGENLRIIPVTLRVIFVPSYTVELELFDNVAYLR